MSDSLSYQGLLPHSLPSNVLFLPYPVSSEISSSAFSPISLVSSSPSFNQFPSYTVPGVKTEDAEVALYIRQLAECKLKELDFQKAQVHLLKESISVFPNPNITPMNFVTIPPGACTTNGCAVSGTAPCPTNIKTLPMPTPIVPSPVLLSSYPSLSPFAPYSSIGPKNSSTSYSDNGNALNVNSNNSILTPTPRPVEPPKSAMHPLSEVISLFPARKSFICPETGCGKALKTRLGLERHSRNHTGGRRFVCTVKGCNKKFLESNTLKRHVRIHTGEKPFLCPTEGCGRSFSDGSNYRRHLSTHSKEKPFKCPFAECKVKPFGFTRAATLRKHLLNFHNVKVCS